MVVMISVECAALTQTNGLNLNHSTNGTLTEITFTCDTGFTLTGTQQTTCLTNGSWDSAAPSCGELYMSTEGTKQR